MRIEIPFKLVSLQDDGYHCLVNGLVNGRPLMLVLDTGASRSCFDIDLIKEIIHETEIKTNDSMTSGVGSNSVSSIITKIKEFRISDLLIKNYQAVGIDMGHIHHAYSVAGLPRIEGILGADILTKYKAVIDFRKRKIVLNSAPSKVQLHD